MVDALSQQELQRYDRQLKLKELSYHGQQRLKASKVAVIGVGGLGCPVATYLAAAGVGSITLFDHDMIEFSNLPRQTLYRDSDIGMAKAEVAAKRLSALNPMIQVLPLAKKMTKPTLNLLSEMDLVFDCTDQITLKYLLNDFALMHKKAWVTASVYKWEFRIGVFSPGQNGCYRCLFPDPPLVAGPSCDQAGVLGATVGSAGSLQANSGLRLLLDKPVDNKYFIFDSQAFTTHTFSIPGCNLCQEAAYGDFPLKSLVEVEDKITDIQEFEVSMPQLKTNSSGDYRLIDLRSLEEFNKQHLVGAIHIPYEALSKKISAFLKNDMIVFYCSTGNRSLKAVHSFRSMGFKRAFHLSRGMQGIDSIYINAGQKDSAEDKNIQV